MKTSYLRWLVAGIGALLLMSSFTIYLILRDRQKIDTSFAAYREQLDSLYTLRNEERQMLRTPLADVSVPKATAPDTTLRNFRIREAELRLHSEHTLADTQKIIHSSDNKKLLWTSLMGVAGLIGLAILIKGNKRVSA